MPLYRYKVLDKNGMLHKKFGAFQSLEDLESNLSQHHSTLLKHRYFYLWPWKRFSLKEQSHFFEHMATFLKAQLPLMEALRSYKTYHPKHEEALMLIEDFLTQGRSLSEGFKNLALLSPLFIHTLEIAEHTGRLGLCFQNMHAYCANRQRVRKQVKQALSYPLMVFVVMLCLLIFFAPTFVQDTHQLLGQLGHTPDVPWVINCLNALNRLTFIHVLSTLVPLIFIIKTPLKKIFHPMLFHLQRTHITHHFFQRLTLQITAGIHLSEALQYQAHTEENRHTQKLLKKVHHDLEKGQSLSQTLKEFMHPFPFIIPLLKMGEETGTLNQAFEKIIHLLELRLTQRQEFLLSHIQPLFLILIGLFLMGVVLSLFHPLYDVLGTLAL